MLDVRSLSCRRGARLVFRDISFRLKPGALLQITGANGSGKSSLLRALAGLLPVSGGEIFWNQQPVASDQEAHRVRLHYVGHLDALKQELSGHEMMDYWQALYPASANTAHDAFGISAFLDKPIRHLSAGQKRRLTLSRLMQSEAQLWLLDEPTTALDSAGQDLLLSAISNFRDKGGIVIAAMHHALDVPDIENLVMEARR